VDSVASMLYLDYAGGGPWVPTGNGGARTLRVSFLQDLNAPVSACPYAIRVRRIQRLPWSQSPPTWAPGFNLK
jgi:hypothetical protein